MNDFGPPPPVLNLTYEQEFHLARFITAAAKEPKDKLVDCVTEQQRQIFVLKNTISELLRHWNYGTTTPALPPTDDE